MSKHFIHSGFREKLIEHLFIGEMLKLSWKSGHCSLEVLKPEVDNAGYDIVLEDNNIIRHIQLKASRVGGKTSRQTIHTKLLEKPSGCMIWILFDEVTLDFHSFYYFGSIANTPLPSLDNLKTARHTKGNASGYKSERPNIRVINKGDFVPYSRLEDLYHVLFTP